jgi:uncharacterized protein YbjT (DUF2867 family)
MPRRHLRLKNGMPPMNSTFVNRIWASRFCGRTRSCKISSLTFRHATARFICRAGNGTASFVDTRDIASVATDVLISDGHEGKIYTLTGPVALGIVEVARILAGVAGRDIHYVDVSEAAARDGMLQAGIPKWQVDPLMELHAINKQNRWSAVTSDVEKVTGKPATDFAQFARDHVENFRSG